MGFFHKRRIAKSIDAAYAALSEESAEVPSVLERLIADVEEEERLSVLLQLGERLVDNEAFDAARAVIEQTLRLYPDSWDALALLAQVERHAPGRTQEAIGVLRRLLDLDPGNVDVAADLALLLTDSGDPEEALKILHTLREKDHPVVALRMGEALAALGREAEAVAALRDVQRLYEYRLKHGMLHGDAYEMREHMMQAARLYASLRAEAVLQQQAAQQSLEATDTVEPQHPTAVGLALRASSERIAEVLDLRSPEETRALAESRLEKNPNDAVALALLGSALLRLGKLPQARARFEEAIASDPHSFPAHLGLGAVLDFEQYDLLSTAEQFVPPPSLPGLRSVLPDFPALTEREQAVAWASLEPLFFVAVGAGDTPATRLPAIRILPIDVRPSDLAPKDEGSSQSLVPPSVDGIRILDTRSIYGWELARLFARLTFSVLPGQLKQEALRCLAAVRESGWTLESATPEEDSELFALTCVAFLMQRHGLAEWEELGDSAALRDMMGFLAEIAEQRP